ncbi:MAG TPA: hypothetical protein VMJ32_03070 [Pirellulales bacterium]|nr:hypothetical protein [Pirellulales bacterium]
MPKWWLITWTTYGSWLPGDPRGFRTWRKREYVPPPKRYAAPGEPVYNPSVYAERRRIAQQTTAASISLTKRQQLCVLNATVDEIRQMDVVPAIISIGTTHVHWLAQFERLSIRLAVGRIKAKATLSLREIGFDGKRPWTKNCHMESKQTDDEFHGAFRYIHHHVHENCLIHVWPSFADIIDEILNS